MSDGNPDPGKANIFGEYYTVGAGTFDTLAEAKETAKAVFDEPDKIANVVAAGIFKNGDKYLVKYLYR